MPRAYKDGRDQHRKPTTTNRPSTIAPYNRNASSSRATSYQQHSPRRASDHGQRQQREEMQEATFRTAVAAGLAATKAAPELGLFTIPNLEGLKFKKNKRPEVRQDPAPSPLASPSLRGNIARAPMVHPLPARPQGLLQQIHQSRSPFMRGHRPEVVPHALAHDIPRAVLHAVPRSSRPESQRWEQLQGDFTWFSDFGLACSTDTKSLARPSSPFCADPLAAPPDLDTPSNFRAHSQDPFN